MNQAKKEELINELIEGLDETVYENYMYSVIRRDKTSEKIRKHILLKKCEMWYEQAKERGEKFTDWMTCREWVHNKIEEKFQNDNEDFDKIQYKTFCDMLNENREKVKINKEIEDYIWAMAPQISNRLIEKMLYFSDVLQYLLNADETMPYLHFGLDELREANEENIELLRTFSCEEIKQAMIYVDGYIEHENAEYQEDIEELIECREKEITDWLEEKTIEEIYLINKYWYIWKMFEDTDFKVWLALYDEKKRISIDKLLNQKRIVASTLRDKLPLYNDLLLVDWSEIEEELKEMDRWDDNTFYANRKELIDSTAKELAVSFDKVEEKIDKYLEKVVENIGKQGAAADVKDAPEIWFLFLQVVLILTDRNNKIEQKVLDLLKIREG